MIQQTKTSVFVRALVKTIFVLCYMAFMWASIHKVAFFFSNFEAENNWIGSYSLAGAFDITALVATIGVMFFRRSMPLPVQLLVWLFIIAIASFSYMVNWEYDAHFQLTTLTLQATGDTQAVFDRNNVLQYVPVMRQNPSLLMINPLLASGFTIFSLIYSVVAEFFGTKPPTVSELRLHKEYLEETKDLKADISRLSAGENENEKKGGGILGAVLQGKQVWKVLTENSHSSVQDSHDIRTSGKPALIENKKAVGGNGNEKSQGGNGNEKARHENSHQKSRPTGTRENENENETDRKGGEKAQSPIGNEKVILRAGRETVKARIEKDGEGLDLSHIARETGIPIKTLYRWRSLKQPLAEEANNG